MRGSGVCAGMFAYKAVCVLWSIAATCTLSMTAVADVGTEAPAVALLSTHRLRHCQETDAGRRQRTCDIHLRSLQRALRIYLHRKDRIQMCHWGNWRVARWNLFPFFPRLSTCAEWARLQLKPLCQTAAIISHGFKAAADRDTVTAVPLRLHRHRDERSSAQAHRLPYSGTASCIPKRHIYRVHMCTAHNTRHVDEDSV